MYICLHSVVAISEEVRQHHVSLCSADVCTNLVEGMRLSSVGVAKRRVSSVSPCASVVLLPVCRNSNILYYAYICIYITCISGQAL